MRRFVSTHPKYADMAPWTGRETSDITYMDTNGILTELLINEDYLDQDTWLGKRPNYFIEVKATLQSCETPFYMSKAQYQRVSPRNATRSQIE